MVLRRRAAATLVVALGVATFASVVAERSAQAFCSFYVSGTDAKLRSPASQIVVMREGTRTVLSIQNDYQGPRESFAMVVPVPVVVQKENVKTLPREIFARIDQLDAPRLVEYWEQDPCAEAPPPLQASATRDAASDAAPGATPTAPTAPSSAGTRDLGITIEAQFTVGEYDIVVLGAKDSSGLQSWLRRERYKLPAASEALLRPYVESGSKFFIARVDPSKLEMKAGRAALSPLRFHYDSPQLVLPIRLGLMSSPGVQDLIVHVLARGRRYQVANYPNVTIPTNLDVTESARDRFGSFYAALFDRTIARTPKAVVTEYAWDVGACHPCPSPPLADRDLVTLGADVLPSVASESELVDGDLLEALGADAGAPSTSLLPPASGRVQRRRYYGLQPSFVLTRLHARYTRDALAEDLVLEEAPAIRGGREVRTGPRGALETGATLSSEKDAANTFQARYAVRHPWGGPITCGEPLREVWGGPPSGLDNGGARPALGLAYVARDNVQLASFLRTDVAALDVQATGAAPSGVGTFTGASAPPPGVASAEGAVARTDTPGARRPGCSGCTAARTSAAGTTALALGAAALGLIGLLSRRARSKARGSRASVS